MNYTAGGDLAIALPMTESLKLCVRLNGKETRLLSNPTKAVPGR